MPEVTYYAGRRIGVIRDGEQVSVAAGQPLPEAADMPKLRLRIKSGHVVKLVDGKPHPSSRVRARQLRIIKPLERQPAKEPVAGAADSDSGSGGAASSQPASARPKKVEKPKENKKRKFTRREKPKE